MKSEISINDLRVIAARCRKLAALHTAAADALDNVIAALEGAPVDGPVHGAVCTDVPSALPTADHQRSEEKTEDTSCKSN